MTAADFDLDVHLDVASVNAFGRDGTNGDVSVYLGNGHGAFGDETVLGVGMDGDATVHPRAIAVGHFNEDGKPDLATANDLINGTLSVLINTSQ